MFKTNFNDNETKALIAKYYDKYEGKKVESVTIRPRVIDDSEFVKSINTSVAFVVKCVEEIEGIEKVMEEYIDIDMVCGYMTTFFEELGFRDVLVTVRSGLTEEAWAKDADETVCRDAEFGGLVLEYTHKENLEAKTAEPVEPEVTEPKTTKSTRSTKTTNATLTKKKGK